MLQGEGNTNMNLGVLNLFETCIFKKPKVEGVSEKKCYNFNVGFLKLIRKPAGYKIQPYNLHVLPG